MPPEGLPTFRAAWEPLDDERRAVVLHDAATEESRYRLSKAALHRGTDNMGNAVLTKAEPLKVDHGTS